MIVIEHIGTGRRFRYPSVNANIETPTGFVQVQYVPREFKLSSNQDSSDIPDYHQMFQETQTYPAQPNDPLNQYEWRDQI